MLVRLTECWFFVQELKAEGVIYLPAFQVSPAPTLKTKKLWVPFFTAFTGEGVE